jgi:hypothetical protein
MKTIKPIAMDLEDYRELLALKGKLVSKNIAGKNLSYSKVIRKAIDHYNKTVA